MEMRYKQEEYLRSAKNIICGPWTIDNFVFITQLDGFFPLVMHNETFSGSFHNLGGESRETLI